MTRMGSSMVFLDWAGFIITEMRHFISHIEVGIVSKFFEGLGHHSQDQTVR